MHENRTTYPEKKVRMFQELTEVPKQYKVMALVKMEKVRASQILPIRKILGEDVRFLSIKNKVARLVLAKSDIPGIKDIADQVRGQCLFMFTNMSPFKLNVLLAKNKVMMAARGGDIASIDVKVPAKNTGIAPGPMLTEFKEAGIPTKIDQGTIWILKDSVPVKKGEPIPNKLAALLSKLDIKPVEAGIVLESALEDGLTYKKEDLQIDIDKVREEFATLYQQAVSLSIEAGYVTAENINTILAKAAQHARSVSVESGFMTDDTRDQILQKGDAHARGLASKAKDYTPN